MLVSIIIPCHNSEATISRAVDSVLYQTWKTWELILVNNNSTDNTRNILEEIKLSNPDQNITVLDETKKGAPAARNKGLYEAKGEWIQFLDADDELLPDKFELQMNNIEDHFDAIYSPYYDITSLDTPLDKQSILQDDSWEALIKGRIGITSSNLFRKKALLSIGGWEEDLSSSQDTTLAFHLLRNGNVFFPLDIPLANKYSLGEPSITNTKDKEKIKKLIHNYINLRKDILLFLKDKKPDIQKFEMMYDQIFADLLLRYFHASPLYTFSEYNKKTRHSLVKRLKTNYSFSVMLVNRLLNNKS